MLTKILLTLLLVVSGLVTSNAQALEQHMLADGSGGAASAGHPKHIPLTGQSGGMSQHGFNERALVLRARRQEIIASNIANADTPNYKAVDIDVQKALKQAHLVDSSVSLAITRPTHLRGRAATFSPAIPLKYHVPQQASIDGNTVDMDVERAKFSGNALMYQFSLDRVGGHYKMMNELLNNLRQ
jgi:flagellar basal-body rod protein FlgB